MFNLLVASGLPWTRNRGQFWLERGHKRHLCTPGGQHHTGLFSQSWHGIKYNMIWDRSLETSVYSKRPTAYGTLQPITTWHPASSDGRDPVYHRRPISYRTLQPITAWHPASYRNGYNDIFWCYSCLNPNHWVWFELLNVRVTLWFYKHSSIKWKETQKL
jgi:hypothetical protein